MVPRVTLAGGAQLPAIGLGTWPMTSDEAAAAVAEAISLGYRMIDTAYAYGNEEGVGRGVRASGVPREELLVTTKLNGEWHGYDAAQRAFEGSARRLGVDYVDLYLIHWPMPWQDRYIDAWRGLIKLREDGRVRVIGTSNFKPAHIQRLVAATGVAPEVNQIELSPLIPQEQSRAFHAEHGIALQSWSPLGLGAHQQMSIEAGVKTLRNVLDDPVVVDLARHYGRTPAQIVLRWHVELGVIPIPKSAKPERLAQNLDIFDFALQPADVAAIRTIDPGDHRPTDSDAFGH
jgi:2,5-diketo-D-gluconate reductase A